jgi:hypothetical protein
MVARLFDERLFRRNEWEADRIPPTRSLRHTSPRYQIGEQHVERQTFDKEKEKPRPAEAFKPKNDFVGGDIHALQTGLDMAGFG